MVDNNQTTTKISLEEYGIKNVKVQYQLSSKELHDKTLELGQGKEAASGALSVNTGEFTGRSPKDRYIVKDKVTEDKVWWGNINIPFSSEKFDALYDKVAKYLSGKEVYVRDSYAGADDSRRLNIRVITETPWANKFAHNMFLRPTEEELRNFDPEWLLVNVPSFMADLEIDGTRQHNFAILNFSRKIVLIGGTGYTGEIKKGIFSALNFIMPVDKNTLPMHCSANVGDNGETAIFFGLSGTGKTTLSANPDRKLIGDDEHGWGPNGIFNFEGGCYAKCVDLTEEKEPDIFRAVKHGAILENIKFFPGTNKVNFEDTSITQNTRVSYPIYHIDNIAKPSIGPLPKNIFFLCYDAFGVVPPISKLTREQAEYFFVSGYTSKVAGTEAGVDEPQATFSACFGAAFIPLHPAKYAEMLGEKLDSSGANVWLMNTGMTGGGYGVGSRMSLKYTRSLVEAALNGQLENEKFETIPVFNLAIPTACPNVPSEILNPRSTWENKGQYDRSALELGKKFIENFKKYEAGCSAEILSASPTV